MGQGQWTRQGVRRACVVAALVLASPWAPLVRAAMPDVPRPQVIGVERGLPSTYINGITEDRDGYVWIATTDGLARYDGSGMQVWRHDPADPGSLPGNLITAVHVDARNRVWAAVEARGLSMLDAGRQHFRHFRMADAPGMGSDDVFAIASRGDAVWFGTYGGGLHRLSDKGDIERYMPREGDPGSLPSETITSLAFDDEGVLWIGSLAGLAAWDGRRFERVDLPGESPRGLVYSVTARADGVWVGAASGVFLRSPDGHWQDLPWAPMFAKPNAVLSVVDDHQGHLWLGTQRSIWHVAPGRVPVPAALSPHGPTRLVQQLHAQANGGLWMPVAGRGLGYLRPDWRTAIQLSRENGLTSSLYLGMVPSADGGLWLMGERGEMDHLDADGLLHPSDEDVREALTAWRPTAIAEDRRGRLWLGTAGLHASLLRIDGPGRMTEWAPDSARDPTLGGAIPLMKLARDGTLWMVSSGGGVQQRDTDSGRVLTNIAVGADNGLGGGDLEAIGFDGSGVLWVAGDDGLMRWEAARGRFQPLPDRPGERVYGFDFHGADALWVQRLSGLSRYRLEGGEWRLQAQVGAAEGIPAVEGMGLHVDARGRAWLATARGLYRWDPTRRQLRRFGLADGLTSHQFVDHSTVLTADGVLAGAVEDGGVVLVDTRAEDPAPSRPPLHWDRIEVRRDGQWTPVAESVLARLPATDRELRVRFRLLAYENPDANRYFTRLDGYDRDWVAQGAQGERILAGLAPGDHVLRVRGEDAAGNASKERLLRFTVMPPWWHTPPAWAGFAGLLALVAWGLTDLYHARLRQKHGQERIEHEREVALQASLAKTRFLATLGHEVRTPMTGVLGMSELLLDTGLDARQRGYTEAIRSAGEHLLRLVNDALDLSRIESGKLELESAPFDLHALIHEVAALSEPMALRKGLAFSAVVTASVPQWVLGDRKRVCQILLNLLGNAIKFTDVGRVGLRVDMTDAAAICFHVDDTGPGLNREQTSRLFRRFEQAEGVRTSARYGGSGLGLAICQELTVAMSGHIEVDSEPGRGARFDVILPLPASDARPAPAPAPAADVPSLRILLVEDDPTVADVMAGLLRSQGHRVVHVGHALAGLSEAAAAPFDVALLDLDLPGLDGLALARQLRRQGFSLPLVAITARADAEAETESMDAGFDHFLRKPLTGRMLAEALSRLRAGR